MQDIMQIENRNSWEADYNDFICFGDIWKEERFSKGGKKEHSLMHTNAAQTMSPRKAKVYSEYKATVTARGTAGVRSPAAKGLNTLGFRSWCERRFLYLKKQNNRPTVSVVSVSSRTVHQRCMGEMLLAGLSSHLKMWFIAAVYSI